MLNETVEKYTADATRLACADAGDNLDDANFSRDMADTTILTLVTEDAWITEIVQSDYLRTDDDLKLMDRILLNEVNRAIAITNDCFSQMHFKDGLKACWFEMLNARNDYRTWSKDSDIPMHASIIRRWAEALVVMICPICPHW